MAAPAARLFVRTTITLLVGLGPVAALAWPRLDRSRLAYLAVYGLGIVLVNLIRDADANLEQRGEDQGSESLLGLSMTLGAIWAAADVGRLHLTDGVPEAARWGAVVVLAVGTGLRLWAMQVNRFFSNRLVIQAERGHQVIDRGPYARVRHPGYTTFLVILPAMPIAIGSWSALGVFALGVFAVLRRTAREDRFLHENLEGYPEYASRVRARLVPGLY